MKKIKKLRYQLEHDYHCDFSKLFKPDERELFNSQVGAMGISFHDTEGRLILTLKSPCTIIVHRGYRWDGCSPKFNFLWLDLFWIGTPDGLIIGSERPEEGHDQLRDIPITNERVTSLASMVHDVLGYCKKEGEMPDLFKAQAREYWWTPSRLRRDYLFFDLLRRKNFRLSRLYYLATISFGPIYDLIFGMSSVSTDACQK
ncbi:MAG: hypothetical protein AB4050_15215 [Synechococcus sp.]